ncbi:Two-component sensor histidine kinase [Minicystis rosea]|nr:Two-component sensor histidine kinase [Minicystis rosea]
MLHRAKRSPRRGVRRQAARVEVLRRSLSLLRATIDSTTDGILVVNRTGRIAAYNRRFAEMWDLPRGIATGDDDGSALQAVRSQLQDPEAFLARVRALYQMPEAESFDVIELCDGRIFERYSQPQRVGRRVIGRVWSFRDVTDRRRAETERDRLLVQEQAARAAAERAVRARDDFFLVASHELKTPLTSLLLSVQHLIRAGKGASHAGGTTEIRPALEVVERQGRRLAALIDMLLDVSRLQAARIDLCREEVDLAEVVRTVASDLRADACLSGSEIALALPGSVRGVWDRARVSQAVTCLVVNALKYGAGRPVELTCTDSGGVAVITVRDFGVGIEQANLDRIFERFERASSARHYGGFGLGLFFARRIVEAHGGSLRVESAPCSGSTFTVRLPIAIADQAAGRATPA